LAFVGDVTQPAVSWAALPVVMLKPMAGAAHGVYSMQHMPASRRMQAV
jgi:hypothetical protein